MHVSEIVEKQLPWRLQVVLVSVTDRVLLLVGVTDRVVLLVGVTERVVTATFTRRWDRTCRSCELYPSV